MADKGVARVAAGGGDLLLARGGLCVLVPYQVFIDVDPEYRRSLVQKSYAML